MLSTTEFREGLIFEDENGQLVEILDYQHHRKSQARAVVRVKLRNIHTGALIETAYRPEDKFKEVDVEKRPFTYLYTSGDRATFMNSNDYEQVYDSDSHRYAGAGSAAGCFLLREGGAVRGEL